MEKRIIYKNDDGGVSIIIPSPDCGLTIERISAKDVPFGKPYKIIDSSEIPDDITFRAAWDIDEALLSDGVGADYGAGSDWDVAAYLNDGTIIIRNSITGEFVRREAM